MKFFDVTVQFGRPCFNSLLSVFPQQFVFEIDSLLCLITSQKWTMLTLFQGRKKTFNQDPTKESKMITGCYTHPLVPWDKFIQNLFVCQLATILSSSDPWGAQNP